MTDAGVSGDGTQSAKAWPLDNPAIDNAISQHLVITATTKVRALIVLAWVSPGLIIPVIVFSIAPWFIIPVIVFSVAPGLVIIDHPRPGILSRMARNAFGPPRRQCDSHRDNGLP